MAIPKDLVADVVKKKKEKMKPSAADVVGIVGKSLAKGFGADVPEENPLADALRKRREKQKQEK